MGAQFIYQVKNKVSGKRYIGKSCQPKKRWAVHLTGRCPGCIGLARAVRKHGADAFDCCIVEECTDADVNDRERHYIAAYNTIAPNGYNLMSGGEGGRMSEESKQKMREACKRRLPVSVDTRRKMSASHTGERNHAFGKEREGAYRVAQYTMRGDLVTVFSGVTKAARAMMQDGSDAEWQATRGPAHNIQTAIAGTNKQVAAYGYRWRYVKDDAEPAADIGVYTKPAHPSSKRVEQLAMDGTVVAEFRSCCEAARAVGAKHQNIQRCCAGKGDSCKGFRWRYSDVR